ncbi:MAG: hypothetical protein ACOYX5_12620 [Actinomycetota bacterium]
MSRVVYLHVGAPKTGTTFLQDRLRQNRNSLADHGVHYPLGLLSSHFRPALDLVQMDWGGLGPASQGQWDALMRRVRRLDDTVIIDHEILSTATPEQVKRAMDDLASSDEVHIVYSARDIARQIPAEWQEGIKLGRRWTYKRFIRRVRRSFDGRKDMPFWRSQGLPDVLMRWGAGLPPERVHVVTVPQAGAEPDLLWRRFCQVFGIDPAWAPEDRARANESMGIAEIAVVRQLNTHLAGIGIDFTTAQDLIKELLVNRHLAQRDDLVKATLPPRLYPWAEEVANHWIDWIEGSGIDVVGDVEDLRPVPPPKGARWADPDRPDPAQVAEAAIEALAVMTREAAEREDPNAQITVRMSKAARRLRGEE